jgi:hypothetical protein
MSGGAKEQRIDVRRVLSAAGDLLVVEGAEPLPVGTRVCVPMACLGAPEPEAEPLHGKIIDVRRAAEAYAMTLRLHSVTRSQRDAIVNSCR